jgi:hypothetical protein
MDRFKRDASRSELAAKLSSQSRLRAAEPASASNSGEHSRSFGLVREVLLTYLSPILVDSVLTRALQSRKLAAASLNEAQLAELASDIMVGLRLFVPEERLPTLMLALAEVLESPT